LLSSIKQRYWNARRVADNWNAILFGGDRVFREIVLKSRIRPAKKIAPIVGETADRALAAVRWLAAAQDANADGGVSYGYFPVSAARGWDISYPETTGYIMTSLIAYGRRTGQSALIDRALRMAQWEAGIQMPNGAVQGGKVTIPEKRRATTFNTGMVLDGFVSVLQERENRAVLRAAERAADFLVGDLNDNGLFMTNGPFVSADAIKTYNVLCAWAMHRMGELTGTPRYREAALRAVEGALKLQNANGWFAENCLEDRMRPLTHTIGYTAQGILEVGAAAGREDFIAASERCIRGVLPNIGQNGYLAGCFDSAWRPAARWVCLTGSAQIAIVAYRLFELRGDRQFAAAADRLVNFLKAVQRVDTGVAGIDGALSGAYPITGDYMTNGYPNWATKYLLDALMLQASHSGVDLLPVP
jgi:uncharacterized protein YyaL (SSP411 family)